VNEPVPKLQGKQSRTSKIGVKCSWDPHGLIKDRQCAR
jgi:hypothetical protein